MILKGHLSWKLQRRKSSFEMYHLKKKKRFLKNYLFSFKSQCLAVSIRLDASDVMWFGAIQNLHEIFK